MRYLYYFALVALVFCTSNAAKADLLLFASTSDSTDLVTGGQMQLTISVQSTSAGLLIYNGGDFTISSGSNSTFQNRTYAFSGSGGWFADPGIGATTAIYSGGPTPPHLFFNAGDTLELGTIDLRAGSATGNFQITFSGIKQLDGSFLDITTTSSPFSYTVSAVPEPSSMALLGCVAFGGYVIRRRRLKAKA
jgi:hypothetical protein